MTVLLSKEQEDLVQQLLQSGRYGSSQAVLEEALKLLEDKLERLRSDLRRGLDSLDQGLYNEYSGETVQAHLEAIKQRNQARLNQ